MKPMSVQTIADYCGGRVASGDAARICRRTSTDSRSIQRDDFSALGGQIENRATVAREHQWCGRQRIVDDDATRRRAAIA